MKPMSLDSRNWLVIAVAILLTVSGCERGSPDAGNAAEDAARENVDAMSREHADDTTAPSEAASVDPVRPVDSETFAYAALGDTNAYGYFAVPAGVTEPLPGVVMIHEWWGLNDNVRAMANRLAAEGYMVLAVDLYGGEVAATPAEARQQMLTVVQDPDAARENIRQALEFLNVAGAPKIASLGWCFGGGWSLNTAMDFPDLVDASVIYYGQVTADEGRLGRIDDPLLGLFAADDRGIPVDSVNEFEAALTRLDKQHEIHIYPGVGHAFANPTGRNYDAGSAEDAWAKTLAFLGEQLAGNGD